MILVNEIKNNTIIVFADAVIFSKDAIFKCLYWYGDKFHTTVALENNTHYRITISPQTSLNIKMEELELYLHKLERDLIDFNLRDIVTKETQNIRDLLIAKAFSHGEFDEEPTTDVSDPVGFNIDEIE